MSPPHNGTGISLPIMSYRRYSEEVNLGRLPSLPNCPHQAAKPGYTDWMTMPRHDNFNICLSCYEKVFANTGFRNQFVPARHRPPNKPIACDFGTSPWYRIAWLMTRKHGYPDLRLMHGIATVASMTDPCRGNHLSSRVWYSIRHPRFRSGIPDFGVCYQCAQSVEALFPNLRGIFVPPEQPEPTRDVCALHFAPGRNRFGLYFDLLESASDRAQRTQSAPDIRLLADKVLQLSELDECSRDEPVRGAAWYVMERLPDFTVCPECFHDVVYPQLVDGGGGGVGGGGGNAVARNFFQKPQWLHESSCQLYSDRMREVFRAACRTGDMRLLEDTLRERGKKEAEAMRKLAKIDRSMTAEASGEEAERVLREWKRWE
ncbi:Ser/Arg-related nuclear matrix protein [Pleurostoma richardsiae]|uniref:Ser/Arg-related nuclear matrix protein n=1 Tax=Pleurostoma richardsiae TaxID=41990 RepID=A0AA38S2V0_9PEZI|nr:Ser/Arg-related nuclear matrix protein [Pleurostoma richardsiae]